MQRTFKTRLKVNDLESNILAQWCGVSRLAYNVCLDQWNRDYENGVKHNYYSIKKWFNSVKREMFPFITGVSKWVPEAAIKDLDTAFRNMYRHTAKHPRFHKKGVRDSFRIDGSVIAVSGKKLKLPKGLCLRLMERFRYENQVNKINNVTISRKAGYWFASISCDVGEPARENQGAGVLGVDVGVKSLAVCSDGTVIDNPKTLYRREKRKKHLQRMVARKQKGSNNQRKAKALLARYEYRTAVKREDWLHKASSRIVRANRVCFMEDLNVKGMLSNHHLAKAVSDCSFNELHRQLAYKTTVREIDRWYPSSQICSNCGSRKPMPLSERTYRCEQCGMVMDRDINAALNILNVGMANYPELMPAEDDTPEATGAASRQATAPDETGIDHQTLRKNRFE